MLIIMYFADEARLNGSIPSLLGPAVANKLNGKVG
jgi:hypothetical protein